MIICSISTYLTNRFLLILTLYSVIVNHFCHYLTTFNENTHNCHRRTVEIDKGEKNPRFPHWHTRKLFFSREIDKNQNRQFFLRLMMVNLILVYHLEVLATLYAIHAISWVLSCHLHCKISVDFILKLCSLIWQDWGSITKKKCWNFFTALNIYIPHLYPVVFMNIK